MIPALFTGSRVYGKPRKGSDVDLVVLVSVAELAVLSRLADRVLKQKTLPQYPEGTTKSKSLRFGKLNLICCTCPILFGTWVKGTEQLKSCKKVLKKPITRDDAVKTFQGLWHQHNCILEQKTYREV